MFRDYLRIAVRTLTKRKLRSWLTLLGIFIGIAAVVSLISLGAGLKLAVAGQFNILGAERITIQAKGLGFGPPGQNVANPLTIDDLRVVQRVKGVDIAGGRIVQAVQIEFEKKRYDVFITSFPKNPEERAWISEVGNTDVAIGRDINPKDKYKVVLGNDYYEKEKLGRNLRVGDKIIIQGINFEVVGFYERKGAFTVDGIVGMNEEVMREIFNQPDRFNLIVAKAISLSEMDLVTERIERDLRKSRGLELGKEDFNVQTSQQSLQSISQTLDIVTIFLAGIAAISLIVGGIGIMNTMYTSVLERKPEIGIMKAIGARNSDILKIFLIESGMLGFVGGVIGIFIGVGIAKFVEYIGVVFLGSDLLKASFSLELITGSLLFSFLVGAVAGTLPAIQAAKQNPVDALRD